MAELIASALPGTLVAVDTALARLSLVGLGMRSHSGVAARLFAALAAAEVNVENISTSEIVISVLVRSEVAERALAAVQATFELAD